MYDLQNKQILVVGLEPRNVAACHLLQSGGANVMLVEESDSPALRLEADKLRPMGIEVKLGQTKIPDRQFSLAVASPAIPMGAPILRGLEKNDVPVIGEFELGCQQSRCLSLAIAGTNGKGTTGELVEKMLNHNQRKTALCGHGARPVCEVVPESKDLDYLILQVNAFQLETTKFFRPAVAVLMNLTPDYLDRYGSASAYAKAVSRLFQNQQAFDWAIVQSEALAQLQALSVEIPSKIITFSANDQTADIFYDRGLIISRLPNWSWPLLDMSQCQLRGMHNAENLMAALAVGRVLRVPLESMIDVLKTQPPGDHRFEPVGEFGGVEFIDDSKATNVDALHKALLSLPASANGEPNTWLIAGGNEQGQEYHYVGPLLSQRVKGAILIGESREKLRAAWSLFTPCTVSGSLLEAVKIAAKNALPGDVVLLSPACSSFDQFQNYRHRGEMFQAAIKELAASRPNEREKDRTTI